MLQRHWRHNTDPSPQLHACMPTRGMRKKREARTRARGCVLAGTEHCYAAGCASPTKELKLRCNKGLSPVTRKTYKNQKINVTEKRPLLQISIIHFGKEKNSWYDKGYEIYNIYNIDLHVCSLALFLFRVKSEQKNVVRCGIIFSSRDVLFRYHTS